MNNFFTASTGELMEPTDEVTVGGFQPIMPAGTRVLCNIAGIEIEPADDYGNNEHIVIELHIVERGEFYDFTNNHKLHINDNKSTKRDKARNMLLSYDKKCRGELLQLAQQGKNIIDQNVLSRALNGGQVLAEFDVWDRDIKDGDNKIIGTEPGGNWVRGIYPVPADNNVQEQAIGKQPTQTAPVQQQQAANAPYQDDIPF